MSKFLSGRQSNLKLGVSGYTENKTVLETTGKVGIGTTDAQSYSLFVVGDTNVTGLVSATAFYGDGSNLENTGATLSAAAGTQRLVVTSLTSGTMVDAATDSDLTFNATTNTLNTDNLIVAGNLTVSGDQTILNTTQLEVEDINIGIASADPKLNNAQLDGAGITIHGSQGDKTLTWDNSNSRLGFNTDVNVANLKLDDNQKATFGDSDDLEIYHDGNSNGVIDNNTGDLYIRNKSNDSDVYLLTDNSSGGETIYVDCQGSTGSVGLRYYGTQKLITKPYGVKVTGITSTQDLNVTGVSTFQGNVHVGSAITAYAATGIVSAIAFYGDGSNLTNTGATLGATSGTERLVTTQLTSGTMVDAATDADLTFDAGNNLLHTPKIDVAGLSPDGTTFGVSGYVPVADGSGGWTWGSLQGASSVNTILNGFTVSEEGNVVGTAGSITQLDFRGVNILASADPQPNGIATISVLLNQSLDSLDVSGIATFRGPVSNGSTTGNAGQYLQSTGVGVTWASFPTLRVTRTDTATAGQTTFNFNYNVNFLDVFVNGVKLTSSEYTANNGSQIVLNTPAFAGEIVEFHSYNITSNYGSGGGGGGGASNLTGLSDVNFPIALADDQLLQFNSSTNVWENVAVTSLPYATEAFVGLSTAGISTAGLASEVFVGLATAGLASETLVGTSTAGLASEAFVGLATAGLLSSTGDASNLTNLTGASAATYGNGTAVPQITVDSNGRITAISNVSISAGGGGGGSSMFIRDSGSVVGSAGTIDFGTGLSVSPVSAGIVTVTSGINTANINADTLNVSGVSTFTNTVNLNAGATIPAGDSLDFGNDFSISRFSNQNKARIRYTGPGDFTFEIDDVDFRNSANNETLMTLRNGGGVSLYHNNNIKLSSTTTGVTVTGTVAATSFSGDGSGLTGIGTVVISDNAPSSPDVGQLWWESDTATGHIYYNDGSTSQWVQFNSGSGGSGSSSGVGTSRFSVSNTTGSIGAGTTADITISGAKAYSLFKIETSHAAWVRLYTDTTSRTSDASRAYTTDPTPGSGVLAEVYTTTSGSNTFKMTPAVTGWNDDATPSTNIYAKVTNNESTSQDITVTLTILRMED